MKDHIDAMQNTLHDAEQHNRRNSIRLYGVPEAVGENTDRAVIQALNSNLPCSLSPDDIESSHRSGKPRVSGPGSGNKTSKPRPILIKLCSYKKKIEIMKVKRNLKRTGLSVHEDLTSRIVYNKLIHFVDKHNILYSKQFGFRKGYSTNHALIDFTDKLAKALSKKKQL